MYQKLQHNEQKYGTATKDKVASLQERHVLKKSAPMQRLLLRLLATNSQRAKQLRALLLQLQQLLCCSAAVTHLVQSHIGVDDQVVLSIRC